MDADSGRLKRIVYRVASRGLGRVLPALWLLCAPAGWVGFASAAEGAESEAVRGRIVSPTLGRPVIVAPGARFALLAELPAESGAVSAALVDPGVSQKRYTLVLDEKESARLASAGACHVLVPPHVPPLTYDIELRSGGRVWRSPHCVAVRWTGNRVRFVHLSNMNLGDFGAPAFDDALCREVNLLGPDCIVLSGDYLDVAHPDPSSGWEALIAELRRFEAPIIAACGDHDDLGLYGQHLAGSPVGVVDIGDVRGVVLYDLPGRPAASDAGQMDWLERTLAGGRRDGRTFVVSHARSPSVLYRWYEAGTLTEMLRSGKVGLWFVGGHRDGDAGEDAALLAAAAPLKVVRTHQGSSAPREGATGVSHYRVVDLVGDRVHFPGGNAGKAACASFAVGRLNLTLEGANNGTSARVVFTAVNNHPFELTGLGTTVYVAKRGGERPWATGGKVVHAAELGDAWRCRVAFDLPEKSSLRVTVGTGRAPQRPTVNVRFEVPREMPVVERCTPTGLRYYSSVPGWMGLIHLHNRGTEVATVLPMLRLDGGPLPYEVLGEKGGSALGYRLRLGPEERATLRVDCSAIHVRPGGRSMQIYLRDSWGWEPRHFALSVEEAGSGVGG